MREITAYTACVAPVIGPDNSYIFHCIFDCILTGQSTVYDPTKDDCGFFSDSHQTQNNCYNYGTDVATNTFAQPGRGSGHKWEANTCEAIRAVRCESVILLEYVLITL